MVELKELYVDELDTPFHVGSKLAQLVSGHYRLKIYHMQKKDKRFPVSFITAFDNFCF